MALRSRVEQLEVALTEAKEEGARAQQTVATAEGRFQRERDELKQTIADAAHERQQLIDSHTLEHAGAGGSVPEQYAELQSICTNFIQTIDPKGAVVPIKKGAFASAEAIANAFHLIAGNAVLSSGAGNSPSGGGGAGSGDDAGSPEGGLLQRRRSFASGSLRNVVASAAVVTSPLSTAAAPAATASKPKKDRKRADPSADFSDVATIEGGALADATVAEYVKKIGATPADAKSGKNVQAVLDELLLKQRQVLHRAMFAALRSASPRGASAGSGGDLSSDNMDVEKTVLAAYDHANDEIERLTEAVLKQKQFATATKEIADKRADEVAQTKALLAKAKEEAAAKHAQHAADLEAVQGNLIGQNNKRLEKLVAKHTKDLSKERKARDAMQAHIDQAAEERSEALRQRDVSIMELESMREQFEATKVELLKMMRSRNASQGSSGYGENVGHSFPGGASGTATMPMSAMSAAQQQQARVDRLRNDVSRAESHTSGGYGANLRPGGGGLPPMNGLPPLRAGPAAGAASAR